MKRRRASPPPPERDAPNNLFRRLPPDAFRLVAEEVLRRRGTQQLARFLGALRKDRITAPLVLHYTRLLGTRWQWRKTPASPERYADLVLGRLAKERRCVGCGSLYKFVDVYHRPEVLRELGVDPEVRVCGQWCWDALFPGAFEDPPPCTCWPPVGAAQWVAPPCPRCVECYTTGDYPMRRLPPAVRRSYLDVAAPVLPVLRSIQAETGLIFWMRACLIKLYPRRPGETDQQIVSRYAQAIEDYMADGSYYSEAEKARCRETLRRHGVFIQATQ